MSKYDIYGIGGAIVDTEVHVSDRFLTDTKIDRGVMTLVDRPRLESLLSAFCSSGLQSVKKSGGSVCNSVFAASSFGAKTFFSGKVADDIDGDLFINDLNQAGITFHPKIRDPGTTGKCIVMVTDDAERTMCTFLGASDNLSSKEIDRESLKNSEWFFVEGYLLTSKAKTKVIKEAIDFAKTNAVKVVISLSDPVIVDIFGDSFRDVIEDGVDLIFCNRDEALAFTGSSNIDSAVEHLKLITKTFVITNGPNGAIIFDSGSVFNSEGLSVVAIDTNGAGDMFAGAFLYAITLGKSYEWAARFANECAARVVMKFGPRLEPEEFFMIKEKFGI